MSSTSKYPAALDTAADLPPISDTDTMEDVGKLHDVQHTKLNKAVIGLENKVGTDNSADQQSHSFRIEALEDALAGGAGLVLGSDDSATTGDNPAINIPAHPSNWLKVTIDGAEFVVPGWRTKPLLPPTNLNAAPARLYMPTRLRCHPYIPFA